MSEDVKKHPPIFYGQHSKVYFVIGEYGCSVCQRMIEVNGVMKVTYGKKHSDLEFFCYPCSELTKRHKVNLGAEMHDWKPVLFVWDEDGLPGDVYPVLLKAPDWSQHKEGTTFASALVSEPGMVVVDRTKFAKRQDNLMMDHPHAHIDWEKYVLELDKPLKNDDAVRILERKPLKELEEGKKELLE